MAELIRTRLLETPSVSDKLTTYAGISAVFYQMAPYDTDEGWSSVSQQPRIQFDIELYKDAERDRIGRLIIDISCAENGIMPEEIENDVKDCLNGVIFSAPRCNPFVVTWKNTQAYQDKNGEKLYVGLTLEFDIIDFPVMETSDPDPVKALNDYLLEFDGDIRIIGRDKLPAIFVPSRNDIAVYVNVKDTSVSRQTNTVTWLDATLVVHVFAPAFKDRHEWLIALAYNLSRDGECIMPDKSPMFIKQVKSNTDIDEITGQMSVLVWYGVLRRYPFNRGLRKAIFKGVIK